MHNNNCQHAVRSRRLIAATRADPTPSKVRPRKTLGWFQSDALPPRDEKTVRLV